MKNASIIIGLSVAIVIGGASLSLAEGGGGMRHNFSEIDADGDGKITQSEMQDHRAARFAMADADGNGSLSSDEMIARAMKRMSKRVSHMIERFDADGDGELSMDEMQKRHKGDMFSQMDTDGDGALSAEEFKAMKGMRGKHHGGGMTE
jgi:Ca2+-binding EF-hand superfamily protein